MPEYRPWGSSARKRLMFYYMFCFPMIFAVAALVYTISIIIVPFQEHFGKKSQAKPKHHQADTVAKVQPVH